jgi:uncharacterized protein (DUF1684 family)
MRRCFVLIGALLIFSLVSQNSFSQSTYQKEIDDWHGKRLEGLKAENGWLNLVGLFWLDEGKNSFGSGKQNKLVFPEGSIEAEAGYFELTGGKVKLVATGKEAIKVNGRPATEAVIFSKDSIRRPPIVSTGNLKWTIIQRDDKIGVRLRDLKSLAVVMFKGVDRFPVDSVWRLPATLQANALPQTIAITNVLGQTSQQQSPGKLLFYINNRPYTLDALEEGKELFIIFGDATSGKTTYPAGRFLSVEKPGADGSTWIDFNKAYDPPCAFTPYATCPLPPKQNILPVAITAGEKDFGHH